MKEFDEEAWKAFGPYHDGLNSEPQPAEPDEDCGFCGGGEYVHLGSLGLTHHWRCRDCGVDCRTHDSDELPHEIPSGYAED